ncbi:MAG: polysaccharide biosynthesis protein [Lachnospiraceae bacterium]|nr:polysaccharide biosynthesis protein [Lachnospiraceae bacterium]
MKVRHPLIMGTALLTGSSLLCRLLGFFYRIFLSRAIGSQGIGLYQLISPLFTLCFCIAASGIATAMTRQIAAQIALNDHGQARCILRMGLLLSTIPAVLLNLFLFMNADWISLCLFGEPECIPLLRLLSCALPFCTIHACINSYYYAQKATFIPATSQILEQIIRLGIAYGYCQILQNQHLAVTPIIAVAGSVVSEAGAALFSFCCLRRDKKKRPKPTSPCIDRRIIAKNLFLLSYPITLNRLSLNLLHSLEAILIPACLRSYGLSGDDALSVFGVLVGMALPFLLFPTAITNSVSTLLLPTVAEEQARGNHAGVRKVIHKTQFYSVLFGILSTLFFFTVGKPLGTAIFQDADCGAYIRTLSFICPFLYLNITVASILNGLGKTMANFRINFSSLVIRIACILFFVPQVGIRGYLYGLLTSEIFASACGLYVLKNEKKGK